MNNKYRIGALFNSSITKEQKVWITFKTKSLNIFEERGLTSLICKEIAKTTYSEELNSLCLQIAKTMRNLVFFANTENEKKKLDALKNNLPISEEMGSRKDRIAVQALECVYEDCSSLDALWDKALILEIDVEPIYDYIVEVINK